MIIAGGSGTRLWPLSTPDFPKHLLKINGEHSSLLQHTYRRARSLANTVYIVSEAGHIAHVRQQLPELTDDAFITEPARRGTASCLLAALAHISKYNDADEPVVFLPADHNIRDKVGFKHTFKQAAKLSKETDRLVLIGIEPTYPATGFGYIQKGQLLNEHHYIFTVESFKEKPSFDVAQQYLNRGNYLWNCGCFVGSVNSFKTAMKQSAPSLLKGLNTLVDAPPVGYEAAYLALENISIDYALIEKVTDLLVVPATFDWMDLGSYADLACAVQTDKNGNHCFGQNVILEEVSNSFVQNHTNTPLAVIGLDNCVVINTQAGIVVTRKDLSQKVGDVSKRFAAIDKIPIDTHTES